MSNQLDESQIPTDPIPADQQSPPWLAHAYHELGVQEVAGPKANPRIVEYLATTSLPAGLRATDETSWCSAFVNWCMLRAGVRGTGLANARSWLDWGVPLKLPRPGAVMVFSRDTGGPAAGHVSLYLETINTRITGTTMYKCLGGNQSNKVCASKYPASRLLGIRWPK